MSDPSLIMHVIQGKSHLICNTNQYFLFLGAKQIFGQLTIRTVLTEHIVIFIIFDMLHKLHDIGVFELLMDEYLAG